MKKKHLNFYKTYFGKRLPGGFGLCFSARNDYISRDLLDMFTPLDMSTNSYWAQDGKLQYHNSNGKFTPLRQTIVLFMAAINGEL